MAPAAEAICRVLHQRVLEQISCVGRRALLKQESRSKEAVELPFQPRLRAAGDCGQQLTREFAADGRPDLSQLSGGAKPVKPRGQRSVQGCRDRQCRRGDHGGGPPRLVLGRRLQHRLGHLLYEQRVGALDDVLAYGRGQTIVPDNVTDHFVDIGRPQPTERDGCHVRVFVPGQDRRRSAPSLSSFALSVSSRAKPAARSN